MLQSYARKFGKLSSGHRTGKGQFSFQSQRKAMPKNAQNCTIALISHDSKVTLKILQARLQQCQSLWLCDHNKLWKILKEMGIPDYLTCFLRNLYAGQEATVRTRHGTTDWFQIEKGVHQGCVLSPCLVNLYAEYSMWNARLDETQAGIKIVEEISITSDLQMTPHLWQKAKRN